LAASARAQELFGPEHVAKVRFVAAAEIAPDGKHVAYVLDVPRRPFADKDGNAWAELHVVEVASGTSRGYVTGDVNVSAIAWTHDGSGVSFLAKRGSDEFTSLYIIPLAGGEARKVLSHGSNITGYSWSPDGKRIAFTATTPQSKEKKELTDKGFTAEIYEEDVQPVRIWVGAPDSAKPARQIDIAGSASELHWAPVGSRIAVALAPTPLVDDHIMHRRIFVIDVDKPEKSIALKNPGKIGHLAWSPDGKHIALLSGADIHDPAEGRLTVSSADGGGWRDLIPNFLGDVQAVAWKDNETLRYVTAEGCYSAYGEVKRDGTGRRTIVATGGPILNDFSLTEDGATAAFVCDSPEHPNEVYVLGPKDKQPRRLTHSNAWMKSMRFAKQEVVKHKARDGLELEGILIRPLDEKPGQRYPLILTVHGGPEAHVSNGWVTRYSLPGQVGAARGFAVFYPNYRGSTGRGVAFCIMGQRDAAGKEFDDLVDAVDHLVGIGLVDTKKVGVTGGSYGGYASAWCATYHTKRFAASVMFVGLSNNISKVGTTDIPYEMNLVHHRKWLWDDWSYFERSSPIKYVQQAQTPILILHGKNDTRVHPEQSMQLYRHLKVLGKVPVRLVLYPGEGHGNRRASSRYDYNLRLMQWMEHYLKGPGGDPPKFEIEYPLRKG
jgi:dipeptidyl aminopeptidase/acylaminoacyl peptidase